MASKRHIRRRSCENKEQYNEATAISIAKRMRLINRKWMNAYKCDFGGHWHVGHPTKRARQSIRDKMRNNAEENVL